MNKFLSTFAALIAFTLLFTACSKSPDKVLDRKDGKWDAVVTTIVIMGNNKSTSVQSGIFFFEGNKYTFTASNGMTSTGTWTADAHKVTLVTRNTEVLELDVIKSRRKEQEWRFTMTSPDLNLEYELTYNLKR